MKAPIKNNQGIALVMVLMVILILLVFTGAGLVSSGLSLRTTSSLRVGTITFQAADAGIQHALAAIPAGGTFSYSTDPASPSEVVPTTVFPSAGYSYRVTAVNTAGGAQAILTSTGNGPNGTAVKVVQAYVTRGSFGFGATHTPGDAGNIETQFGGTSFSVDGNDACSSATVPGITTTDKDLVTEITNNTTSDGGLASNQMANVTGAGGSPSVVALSSDSVSVSDLAVQFLDLNIHDTVTGSNFSGNQNWGTAGNPRITLVTGDSEVSIGGSIDGYGVLILDGALRIQGNFEFHGLVIARGDVQFLGGNATINGSLMIAESADLDPTVELNVAGNARVRFDSCALASADNWIPLPREARIVAWQERLD